VINSVTSGVTAGVSDSIRRFDRAAEHVTSAAQDEGDAVPESAVASPNRNLSDAMVEMTSAKFAMIASLRAAQTTNETLAQVLRTGGYSG
jgi:hypothetical protein